MSRRQASGARHIAVERGVIAEIPKVVSVVEEKRTLEDQRRAQRPSGCSLFDCLRPESRIELAIFLNEPIYDMIRRYTGK